ncbi:hypothetical protein DIE08_27530 [Burkholderia sp. Bp9004]|nr:hypothetical protein DIE08_27530 [Burkholderia sp. Bp9004]
MRDGVVIPDEVRRLVRVTFRAVVKRHHRPAPHRLNMVVDQRMVSVSPSHTASHFRMWARLSTLEKGKPVNLPLQTYPHFMTCADTRALTVQEPCARCVVICANHMVDRGIGREMIEMTRGGEVDNLIRLASHNNRKRISTYINICCFECRIRTTC